MNLTSLLARARQAKARSGKSLLSQAMEILRLHRSHGRIGPSEYFDYGLFDDTKFSVNDKQEFIGWSRELLLNNTFNKSEWAVLALDKIVFYTFLEGAGLPYPRLQAIFDTNGRSLKGTPTYTTADALDEYLKNEGVYPVFVKPSHGNFGRGTFLLSRYEREQQNVVFSDGTNTPVSTFSRSLETKLSQGQIFQEIFSPHPDLVLLCGPRSCTVRVVVIIDKHGPQLLCAVWKIPTGNNVIDNFHHGKTGNLIASVDIASGKVGQVIGQGPHGEFIEIQNHPDTNRSFKTATIPDWPSVQDICLTAARLMPGFRLLHFDVALAEKGPALLEINYQGSLDLLQHASGKGVFSKQIVTALEDQKIFRQEVVDIMKHTMREQHGHSGA